jgi:hypothetical protein
MDDQARAVLLSLSKIVQDEDESITIEEKLKAIVAIGHSLCCGIYKIFQNVIYKYNLFQIITQLICKLKI